MVPVAQKNINSTIKNNKKGYLFSEVAFSIFSTYASSGMNGAKNGTHSIGACSSLMTGTDNGNDLGCAGNVRGNIPASSHVRLSFLELQRLHAVTMFVQFVRPPAHLGTTWSYDNL